MTVPKRLIVVYPHGFCSGVARAVETAEKALDKYCGETVYCLNEIVHNRQVVSRLAARGMIFVSDPARVPEGGLLLFSAHGVSPEVRRQTETRNLRVIDATCPFVTKVHSEVLRFAAQGACVVCIGHRRHEEVVGVAGEAPGHVRIVENAQEAEEFAVPDGAPVAVVTQTTLGTVQVEAVMRVLHRRFPALQLPGSTDVCYATRNRQRAVGALAKICGLVLVLGSENSSNSQRLVETAQAGGSRGFLVSRLEQLAEVAWEGESVVGLTSGASTPDSFLEDAVRVLREKYGFCAPEVLRAVEEDSHVFRLPVLPA